MQKMVQAIVLTSEPILAQIVPSPKFNLADVDKRVVRYAINNDQQLRSTIEKHQFIIPNLHFGRNPSYKGMLKNPFVIQISVHLNDNSNLAHYIGELHANNQLSQLESNYTSYKSNGSYYTLTTRFYRKSVLLYCIAKINQEA